MREETIYRKSLNLLLSLNFASPFKDWVQGHSQLWNKGKTQGDK